MKSNDVSQILQRKKLWGKFVSIECLVQTELVTGGPLHLWTASNPRQREVRLLSPYSPDWSRGRITGTSRFYADFLPNGVQTENKTRNRDFISIHRPFAWDWNGGTQRTRRASERAREGACRIWGRFFAFGVDLRREAAI